MAWFSSSPAALARVGLLGGFVALLLFSSNTSAALPESISHFREQVLPLLKSYCYDCHGDGAKEGNLALDQVAADSRRCSRVRELWWKVLQEPALRSDAAGGRKAAQAGGDRERSPSGSSSTCLGFSPTTSTRAGSGVRRLNRREYDNTIDDLMGIKFDAAIVFPPDDSGYGFDNVGDALSFSPLLMEKYLRAAQTIVDQTVPKVTWIDSAAGVLGPRFSGRATRKVSGDSMSGKKAAHVKRVVQSRRAGEVRRRCRRQAARLVRLRSLPLHRSSSASTGSSGASTNTAGTRTSCTVTSSARIGSRANHELAFELTPLPGSGARRRAVRGGFWRDPTERAVRGEFGPRSKGRREPASWSIRATTRASSPARAAGFAPRSGEHTPRRSCGSLPPARSAARVEQAHARSAGASWPKASISSRTRPSRPAWRTRWSRCWRRRGSCFAWNRPRPHAADVAYSPIDELSLASRLSYFLWSTMPDEELFRLAEAGELRKQLPQQVSADDERRAGRGVRPQLRRAMAADPRRDAGFHRSDRGAGPSGRIREAAGAVSRPPPRAFSRDAHARRAEGSQAVRRVARDLGPVQRRDEAGDAAGNGDVRRVHRPGRSQPAGAAGLRLHVRQREAGRAVRHSGRSRQRDAARRAARRTARAAAC